MLALRLNQETEARLDHMAKITGRSKHFYAIEAVETHLRGLESKYLSAQEQANIQATVDFARIEMALAGELDPDLLTTTEHAHYFDVQQDRLEDRLANPTAEAAARWASMSGSKLNAAFEIVWVHEDGSEKPFPPAK
jgi:RHH-type transcriptional regulator, rel operon repressor / antitoxin RelB